MLIWYLYRRASLDVEHAIIEGLSSGVVSRDASLVCRIRGRIISIVMQVRREVNVSFARAVLWQISACSDTICITRTWRRHEGAASGIAELHIRVATTTTDWRSVLLIHIDLGMLYRN